MMRFIWYAHCIVRFMSIYDTLIWYKTFYTWYDMYCTILTTMVITHFLFIYKSGSFLFYFLEIDMKCWQMEKYKTSAKLGFWEPNLAIMLEVERPKLCFRRCRLFKKIEWVLFLPIVGVFWKKKKNSMGVSWPH